MSEFIRPDWSAPKGVAALTTTRQGGTSRAPWDSFNLADHVGDEPTAVLANRALLRQHLPSEPLWLRQVHGTRCVDAAHAAGVSDADASFTRQRGVVCAVLTADCLPVFLCDDRATVVGMVHAGWRGLLAGVIESTVIAMAEPAENLMAWLGPSIGPQAFEVGPEVREKFVAHHADAALTFFPSYGDRWLCDLHQLARQVLLRLGVRQISGTSRCTVHDSDSFFSYRRDGVSGRMASCIWLE